jgi:hypothetical protein
MGQLVVVTVLADVDRGDRLVHLGLDALQGAGELQRRRVALFGTLGQGRAQHQFEGLGHVAAPGGAAAASS